MAVTLEEHQLIAVNKLASGKVLYGDVGTGKSITAAAYYMKEQAPRDVYVITTAKKRDSMDWDDEFIHFGVGRQRNGTVAGVLTVDSWNQIEKYTDIKDAFFIFDEQRAVGSGKWSKQFIKIAQKNTWIMLTATPGDVWLDYVPLFLANGFYKNKTEFVRTHIVYNHHASFPKVDHYLGIGKLVKQRNDILVHMPYVRHTTRKTTYVNVSFDQKRMDQITQDRWNVFDDEPIKDVAEMFRLSRRLVNEDTDRLNNVLHLMNKHPKLIIFYNFNYELEILRSLTGTLWQDKEVEMAEWNGHKHEAVPTSDRWVYLVQYTAGSEGWNCTSTDSMLFFSLTYSYKAWHQSFGRIDRMNTPFKQLNYYVLMSNSWIDDAIMKSLTEKRSFNEVGYKVPGSEGLAKLPYRMGQK